MHRYTGPRPPKPANARYLGELPDQMGIALVRCYNLDVPVEDPGKRYSRTYPALERHGLVLIATGLRDRWGRPRGELYKPTPRGLAIIIADEPHLLAARSDALYTNNPAQAMSQEPEAVDEATQARISEAGRLRDDIRRHDDSGALLILWDRLLDTLHNFDQAAIEFGVDTRADTRVIQGRMRAIEVKIRRRAA